MATYNWSYRPNIPNKYNIVIEDTPDNVRPDRIAYIALFGNDLTGNGSRSYPFRSYVKAKSVNPNYFILASGVYREQGTYQERGKFIIGDGHVVLDNTYLNVGYGDWTTEMMNINFKTLTAATRLGFLYDCIYDGFSKANFIFYFPMQGTIMKNCDLRYVSGQNLQGFTFQGQGNNTYVNLNVLDMSNIIDDNYPLSSWNASIFKGCKFNFDINKPFGVMYSLFYKCQFKYNTDSDYVSVNNTQELRDFINRGNGYTDSYWGTCQVGDPKFNNEAIGDYSLAFDSPAKNMSYLGTYIGAKSIGYPIKANAAGGDFDLSTNTNLIFSDNSIVLANPTSEGSIESNVLANIVGRELANAPVFGFYADRNGQYLDATEDLSTATISASANLISNTPYLVENAAITYNGAVIQPGERFTTTDVLSFVSVSNGTCLEILEAPQRHTILARFSDGGTVLTSGTALAVGAWYYANGTVNYEGVAYTNQVFKAITTNPFTGSGNVILAMADEAYQLYEPGIKFTSNNAGNTRTGAIIRGNGDPLYERGLEKEFPINAKFIQFRYIIKVNNLKP